MNKLDKISEWVDWMRLSYSLTTIESYTWELRHLEKWAADRTV